MGHSDFRVNNRIFATLHADMQFGMVKFTPGQQEQFMPDQQDAFAPESGAWGQAGLASVSAETLGEARTLAWQNVVSRGASPPSKHKRSTEPLRRRGPR